MTLGDAGLETKLETEERSPPLPHPYSSSASCTRDSVRARRFIHGRPPLPSAFSVPVEAGRDCSHTFGLGERRLAAGPDGISWLTPDQIGGLLTSLEPGRIRQPWSDLFCH